MKHKSTTLSLCLAFLLAAVCLFVLPTEAQAASQSNLTFELNADGTSYCVSDCNETASGTLTIPATYKGKPVTVIGEGAFFYCSQLTDIIVPETVVTIEANAFSYCSQLARISLPVSVTKISDYAFSNCKKLTNVTFSNSVTSIGDYAFSSCTELSTFIMPTSISTIGDGAFDYCIGLSEVHFPDRVGSGASIGWQAFRACKSLNCISIPEGFTTIDDSAFRSCSSLTDVTFPASISRIGVEIFEDCAELDNLHMSKDNMTFFIDSNGVLFNKEKTELLCALSKNISGTYSVPDGVTEIADYAFRSCSNLTGATLPASLTVIGAGLFDDCTNLSSVQLSEDNEDYVLDSKGVLYNKDKTELFYALSRNISGSYTIPNGVTSIGEYAFRNCNRLTRITIPESVIGLGKMAFYNCTGLTNVVIPEGVSSIGAYAFSSCSNLVNITIPDSITSIGVGAFDHCTSLIYNEPYGIKHLGNDDNPYLVLVSVNRDTVLFEMSQSTKIIMDDAFYSCKYLNDITIPDNVTCIVPGAFKGCTALGSIQVSENNTYYSSGTQGELYNKDKTMLICVPPAAIRGSYSVPSGVTDISDYACYYCYGLTDVTIANSVKEIGDYAFYACNNITNIVIPAKLHSIGGDAFYYCNSLTDVWFCGSENDRTNIVGNQFLNKATWHYSCCDPDSHIYDNVCDAACNMCEYVRTVPDHVYTNDCDSSCNECGKVRVTTHTYDHNCDAICNVCDYERTVEDHIYTNSCDTTCNVCGAVRYTTHVYDYVCDNTCNICGYKRNVTHVYENSEDLTCNVCKQTLAPAAPTVELVTETTVTLVAIAGYEYRSSETKWQKSNVFTGLESGTSYDFYQRVAASADNLVSPASKPLRVKTTKYTPTTPSKPIAESITSATVTLKAYSGYEYSMDGQTWQADNVFSGLSPATQYNFYQRIAETEKSFTSASSQPITVTTLQAFRVRYDANEGDFALDTQIKEEGVDLVLTDAIPIRKYCLFKGWSTSRYGNLDYEPGDTYSADEDITLYAVWVLPCATCDGDGETYVTCSECDGSGVWEGELSFCCDYKTALMIMSSDGAHFVCRACGKRCSAYWGAVSCDTENLVECKTCLGTGYEKLTPPAAPRPELLSATLSSITVVPQPGMEYSIDGYTWQTCNVFEGLSPNTQYRIYQRYAENDYYTPSKSSSSQLSTLTSYTVVFEDWDGTILSTETYQYGDAVKIPNDPVRKADGAFKYIFIGWDHEIVPCKSDAVYTAQYEAIMMSNGWITEDGKWYYYVDDVKQVGWLQLGSTWYYMDGQGVMQTGWQQISGIWYYFKSSGAMVTGWLQSGSTWYYFNASGAMVTGWQQIGGTWYYFKSGGAMATGWLQLGNTWYYFNSSGAMVTGTVTINGKVNKFDASGAWLGEVSQNGWVQEGGKWYFYQNGAKATGWKQVSGKWYYFNTSGIMQTGWLQVGGVWYYFQSGGAMQTGWLKLGSTWYYFHSSGAMATSPVTLGGKTYRFDASGACLNP